MSEATTIEVDVHSRAIMKVNASVSGQVEPAQIIRQIARKVEAEHHQTPYAFGIALPGPAPDSVDIRMFDREGRSLDHRSFHVAEKEDGTASLTISQNKGRDWHLVGIFTDRRWAEALGDLWKTGALTVDFSKLSKAA